MSSLPLRVPRSFLSAAAIYRQLRTLLRQDPDSEPDPKAGADESTPLVGTEPSRHSAKFCQPISCELRIRLWQRMR